MDSNIGAQIYGEVWDELTEPQQAAVLSELESNFFEPWFHGFLTCGGE